MSSARSPEASPAPHEHLVSFYEDDHVLAGSVAEFLAPALRGGDGAAVIIATESHRRLFVAQLAALGIDRSLLEMAGRLVLLDARETLSAFVGDDGMPDASRFESVVGTLVARVSKKGAVRAYGEMVDLLWQDGRTEAALVLEELWNDLQKKQDFRLLCAYVAARFLKQPAGVESVCDVHSGVKPLSDGGPAAAIQALAAEVAERRRIEQALRDAVHDLRARESELARAHDELREFVDGASIGLHWVGRDGTILWANEAELRMLGYERAEYVGRHISQFHLDAPAIDDILRRLDRRERVTDYPARLRAKDGSVRHVLIDSSVYERDGKFVHTQCFTRDVTRRKSAEERAERLVRVTAAIAAAVTPEQVFTAVVDQTAAALGASSAGLWLRTPDGTHAHLARSIGYAEPARQRIEHISLETAARVLPAVDVISRREPLWIRSQADLISRYPAVASLVTPGRAYRIACLPIAARGEILGSLGLSFDDDRVTDDEEKSLLLLVAQYAGQAIERLRLLEDESNQRMRAEASAVRLEALHEIAARVIRATDVGEVFEGALDAIASTLGASRASILSFDAAGVMRFRAWRGISDAYRREVDGHSPWTRDTRAPKPVLVSNAATDPAMEPYRALFAREGIASLAFIPLIAGGNLLGKFMLYFPEPRELTPSEVDTASAIANHVAAALTRFSALEELHRSVRFNEMFTGILGHDLRNPLTAIMTAAQLAITRGESEKLVKPLSRIINSGDRMARMIDQLLDFTRVRVGGGIPLVRVSLDLLPILREIIGELDIANPDTTLRLESTGDASGVWDGDRLSQVFSNLIANAIQHGAVADGVRIQLDGTSSHDVSVSVWNAGVVPAELRSTIFEPMTGGDRRRDGSRGLGLGLYISRQIVLAHGGSIDATCDDGGTTFRVVLPRVAPKQVS